MHQHKYRADSVTFYIILAYLEIYVAIVICTN